MKTKTANKTTRSSKSKNFTRKKPTSNNKPEFDPDIWLHKVDVNDKTKDEKLVKVETKTDKIHTYTKLNLVNKLIPIIYYYDQTWIAMILSIKSSKTEIYKLLSLNSPLEIENILGYLEYVLERYSCNKFKLVLFQCNINFSEHKRSRWNIGYTGNRWLRYVLGILQG